MSRCLVFCNVVLTWPCAAELGGALLTPESIATADATKKMVGSMMVYEAANIKEVEDSVKSDIYYTSGVVRASSFDRLLITLS